MVASAAQPVEQVRTGLAVKLLRRALDPACPVPEAENSATKLVAVSRRDGITFDRLTTAISPAQRRERHRRPRRPAACSVRMPFGKYSGLTLRQIATENLAYIRWMATDMDNQDLRDAAAQVLAWFTMGRAA